MIIHEPPADSLSQWKEAADKGMDELIGKVFKKEIYEKLLQLLQEYRLKNANKPFLKLANRLENLLAFLSIFLLALFPFLEVIARKFFHTGIRNSTEYTHHLVLILAFIGAAITTRENKTSFPFPQFEIQTGNFILDPSGQRFYQYRFLHGFCLVFHVVSVECLRCR